MTLPKIRTHLPSCLPCLTSRHRPRRRRKPTVTKLLLLPAAGIILACVLCSSCAEPDPGPPPPTVTDTAPVGEGLKVIGFALLGAAVVLVLGRILK
jgi:hypothetical protein